MGRVERLETLCTEKDCIACDTFGYGQDSRVYMRSDEAQLRIGNAIHHTYIDIGHSCRELTHQMIGTLNIPTQQLEYIAKVKIG